MDRWLYIRKEDDIKTILDALLSVGYKVMFQEDYDSDTYAMQIVHTKYDDDFEMRIIDVGKEDVYTEEEINEIIKDEVDWALKTQGVEDVPTVLKNSEE